MGIFFSYIVMSSLLLLGHTQVFDINKSVSEHVKTRQVTSVCKSAGKEMQKVIDAEALNGYKYLMHCVTAVNSWACFNVITFERKGRQQDEDQKDCVDQPIFLL
jgi:hypothetical protein